MRNIALAALALAALTVLWNAPAQAVGTRHPFCIQGDESPGLSNCTFDSYGQCMATASGRFLTCIANPYFGGESVDPYAYRSRGRSRRPAYYSYSPYPYEPYPNEPYPYEPYRPYRPR